MIPKEIKVAGNVYKITKQRGLISTENLLGKIIYAQNKIVIDSSLIGDRERNVLIHELTHAIFYEAGYDEQDEEMIIRIGNVLHQVLDNNKI